MNYKIKRLVLCVISSIILVIIDRISKIWAINTLKDKESIWITKNALQLYYLPNGNKGAAWGMLEGHVFLFVIIAVIVILAIFYILFFIPNDKKYIPFEVLLVFIASGGIGNMYDRIFQGYVVDFIYFSLINFPIFNVADIYVSVSTVILALFLLFKVKESDLNEIENALKNPFKKKDNK